MRILKGIYTNLDGPYFSIAIDKCTVALVHPEHENLARQFAASDEMLAVCKALLVHPLVTMRDAKGNIYDCMFCLGNDDEGIPHQRDCLLSAVRDIVAKVGQ